MTKVALITGAGQGIGLAIARKLLEEGSHIILNDREKSLTQEAVAQLSRLGKGSVIGCSGDAADPEVIEEMLELAVKNHGTIDQLVCNAGITLFGNFLDYSRADFMEVTRVNQAGTFFFTQAVAQVMKNQGQGGAMLFTSSVTAHQSHENLAAYAMSKAAVIQMTRAMALEWGRFGINVNALCPGYIDTEINHHHWQTEQGQKLISMLPRKRVGQPQDLDALLMLLASDQSHFINGAVVSADDGFAV